MSNMIPQGTVDALRSALSVSLNAVGIECTLFVPLNSTDLESLDPFKTNADRMYTEYPNVKTFVVWSPNQVLLRKLNIYAEDELPIIAYLPTDVAKNIEVDSYLEIPIEVVPKNIQVNKFDIVNNKLPHTHDKVVFSTYVIVPRRT